METLIACERQECQGTTSVVPFGAIKLPALAAVCMNARKTRSAAAKAALHNEPFTARLKSCPDTLRSWKDQIANPKTKQSPLHDRVISIGNQAAADCFRVLGFAEGTDLNVEQGVGRRGGGENLILLSA